MEANINDAAQPSTVSKAESLVLEPPFGVIENDVALAVLPTLIRDIAGRVTAAYEAAPRAVVATSLAVCAHALGRSATVSVPLSKRRVPIAFNLVVALESAQTPGWLGYLTAPLYGAILALQQSLIQEGEPAYKARIIAAERCLQEAKNSIRPDRALLAHAAGAVNELRAGMQPALFTNRSEPGFLKRVIEASFDRCVFLADPAADPVEEFLSLKRDARRDWVRLLNGSWEGYPLSFGLTGIPASLSLLWVTPEEMILPLVDCEALNGPKPPPLLWLKSGTGQPIGSMNALEKALRWGQIVDALFTIRCRQESVNYSMSEEAEVLMQEFSRQVDEVCQKMSRSLARQCVWLPDLARRVAALFSVFQEKPEDIVDGDTAAAAIATVKWLAAGHIDVVMAFEEVSLTPHADNVAPTDNRSPGEVMLRKIKQKTPVSRRQLWRSYDNPRATVFQATLDRLIRDGRIACNEENLLVLVEDPAVRQ